MFSVCLERTIVTDSDGQKINKKKLSESKHVNFKGAEASLW